MRATPFVASRPRQAALAAAAWIGLLAASPTLASPPSTADALAGIPVALVCDIQMAPSHMLFDAHDGENIYELAGMAEEELDPGAWLSDFLCQHVWSILERAGAHPAPDDVRLPARAVVSAQLVDAFLEGTRTVDQRLGASILPVSIPRWALYLSWEIRFHIEHLVPDGEPLQSGELLFSPRGSAEQGDYADLQLGALLRGATQLALGQVPRWLADEGQLGGLLFAVVDRPGLAPPEMGLPADLAPHFWLMLTPDSRARHDALACHLGSDRVPVTTRIQLARWFLLNDSDLPIRRDALGWLMLQEAPAEAQKSLTQEQAELMAWLLRRDRSPRLRSEVTLALANRKTPEVRNLLLLASTDNDVRVSETASSLLQRFVAATTAELEQVQRATDAPQLAPWTIALDGRVALEDNNRDQLLLDLAIAAGGPVAQTWIVRWLDSGDVPPEERSWALPIWSSLANSDTTELRRASLLRLLEEQDSLDAEAQVVSRIEREPDPNLRVLAISGLGRADAPGATRVLLEASRDESRDVRAAAATALAKAPATKAGERLRDLSRSDPDGRVRRKAKQALRKRGRAGL